MCRLNLLCIHFELGETLFVDMIDLVFYLRTIQNLSWECSLVENFDSFRYYYSMN